MTSVYAPKALTVTGKPGEQHRFSPGVNHDVPDWASSHPYATANGVREVDADEADALLKVEAPDSVKLSLAIAAHEAATRENSDLKKSVAALVEGVEIDEGEDVIVKKDTLGALARFAGLDWTGMAEKAADDAKADPAKKKAGKAP